MLVGPGRFELPTSAMSRQRSNQLSYGPVKRCYPGEATLARPLACERCVE